MKDGIYKGFLRDQTMYTGPLRDRAVYTRGFDRHAYGRKDATRDDMETTGMARMSRTVRMARKWGNDENGNDERAT